MTNNSKVTIDLTGDPSELDSTLKKSESLIATFGKKILATLNKVAEAFNYTLQVPARFVTGTLNLFTKLSNSLVEIAKSTGLVNTQFSSLNTVWQNGITVLSEFVRNLQATNQINKDLELNVRLTGKAAGFTSQKMIEYATYLEKVTKYSKEATVSTEQILTHFRDIRGDNFLEATKAAQDMAEALHLNLSQAANEVGNALQNPIQAFAQLEQRNVFFTKKQKETVLKLLEQNKVIEAQAIILDKLKKSFGGAAIAAGDTFGGTLEKVKNRINTVAQTIGNYLVSALNKLTGTAGSSTNVIEAYINKIESLVPAAKALIDNLIPKVLELAQIVKDKLIVAFSYFVDIVITGVSAAQAAYSNFGSVINIITLSFQSKLENLKNNWSIIWTRVMPASLRWFERIFDEIADVKIPNIFTRMFRKLTAMTIRGFNSIVLYLIKGGPLPKLSAYLGNLGTRMMLTLIKNAIEAPLKMGGLAGRAFKILFGLGSGAINAIGTSIGKKLAELDKVEQKEAKQFNLSSDDVENNLQALFPDLFQEKAQKRDLSAPDFAGMFEREETEKEKELKAEIQDLKESLSNDFGDNQVANREATEELKKKVEQYLKLQQEADRKFQEKFGHTAKENKPENFASGRYDRAEAEAKKLRDQQEKDSKKKSVEAKTFQSSVHGLEEFWHKTVSEEQKSINANTKALEDNTKAMKGAATDAELHKDLTAAERGSASHIPAIIIKRNQRRSQKQIQEDRRKRAEQQKDRAHIQKQLGTAKEKPFGNQSEAEIERAKKRVEKQLEYAKIQDRQRVESKKRKADQQAIIDRVRIDREIRVAETKKIIEDRKLAKTTNSKGQSDASRQKDKVALQEAFRSSNKELVTEMKSVNDNTKKIANKKVGVA